MATSTSRAPLAFINLPYAKRYEKVYLAFIAGVAGYGLVPTAAVRDPASNYQLERIFNLISAADYSFHDLSWMALDTRSPRTPRLNMAFELGLAVAITKCRAPKHQWFVFDTMSYRLDKALSDLGGIRPRIHDSQVDSSRSRVIFAPPLTPEVARYARADSDVPVTRNLSLVTRLFAS